VANFLGYNTLTPAQAAYLTYTSTDNSGYTLSDAYGSISDPIYRLPAGDLTAAAGFDYRTDSLFDHPDAVTTEGDAPFFSAATAGGYTTASGYVEVNAPLLKDLPFAKALTLDASGRYDYNTIFGPAWTHKEGLDYAIDDSFRLRGSHSIGFRAPQVRELYSGQTLGAVLGSDPCALGGAFVGSPACRASLMAVGLPATAVPAQIDEVGVINGGSPAVRPETSQFWTAGGVLTPVVVPALSVAVDYYTILIRSEIGGLDANRIVADCYGGIPYVISPAAACKLIGPRNSMTGSLGNVTALNANIANENTDGIDVDVSYAVEAAALGLPSIGKLTLDGQVNYLLADTTTGSTGVVQQLAGTFPGDSAEPRWKALVTAVLATEMWSLSATERYYGGVRNADPSSACEYGAVTCPAKGAYDFEGNETAGLFFTDLSATYRFRNITMTVGVDNLFDKDPPFLQPSDEGNILSTAGYDAIGRFVYMKANMRF